MKNKLMSTFTTLATAIFIGYFSNWQVALGVWSMLLLHKINWHDNWKEQVDILWADLKKDCSINIDLTKKG